MLPFLCEILQVVIEAGIYHLQLVIILQLFILYQVLQLRTCNLISFYTFHDNSVITES